MDKLKYGILSTASIVPRFVHALKESGTGEAVAIASRTLEKAQEKAEEWNIPRAYGSYEELLDDPEIDVVYVAPINSEHYKYAKLALEHSKHVVCEKPFTLKKQEAEDLFRIAKERNKFIAEAQKVVFLPVMQDVKEILQSGRLGTVHMVDMTSSCEATYNTWLHSLANGGGSLYGNASYGIELNRFLFDAKIDAYAGFCTKGTSETDEQCCVSYRIGDVLIVNKISTNVNAINKMFIYGTGGYIEIENYWKARTAVVHYNGQEPVVLDHPCKYELQYEAAHFNECILNGKLQSPLMNEEMTVQTIEMLENIQNSWN